MNMIAPRSSRQMSSLAFLFGSFRPSEREVLLNAANSSPDKFASALEVFLDGWAGADWIEEYNIERVGKWIAKRCPYDVVQKAKLLAETKLGANGQVGSTAKTVYVLTFNALLSGLAHKS
ncbi:hypothetical protein GCM10010873_31860 [Cypionkella aquatica]|uniref:Uncharacterized protein n=1 Tax=Cypionkella aquatica TaxID=1756042 RepID=A0AA37U2F6_9RHOB|nr:hypothetical protein [Cypionkella aquatica]GLS88212.1 hypothetical protein GCM10010873_31860 [Cypionkella aquatica]